CPIAAGPAFRRRTRGCRKTLRTLNSVVDCAGNPGISMAHMTEEQRRIWWLALARVPGAVAAGIAHHLSRSGARGEAIEEAFSGGRPTEWNDLVDEARARVPAVEAEMAAAEKVGARLVDVEDAE